MGFPLAFVALPMYVHLPHLYAREFGLPLALLGSVLLGARLMDAVIDPLLGRWVDALYRRSHRHVLFVAACAGGGLVLGLGSLFFPPDGARASHTTLLVWMACALLVTYASFSLLAIAHQAWATQLGGNEAYRSRIVAWREGLGVVGVVVASGLPSWSGLPATWGVFALAMVLALWAWRASPKPPLAQAKGMMAPAVSLLHPWRRPAFNKLLAVFALNGTASAVSATLVLFFIQDRLGASKAQEPLFLGAYFLCAAISIPLWLRVVAWLGLARAWLAGMVMAIASFVWAFGLGQGDTTAFIIICALSGFALGADLVFPPALLAGVIEQEGDRGESDGAYLGWWNFVTKLNLALAAGVALPLLAAWGYVPGSTAPQGLAALTWVYAGLPCALKALAAVALWWLVIHPPTFRLKGQSK
jgi:glycoside/pentoside/hexuronide:cation symporter, GPH family